MRFKNGEQIVCLKEGNWTSGLKGPQRGDIVTCDGYHWDGSNYIYLKEWNQSMPYCDARRSFIDTKFAPLMDISELTEILQQQQPETA